MKKPSAGFLGEIQPSSQPDECMHDFLHDLDLDNRINCPFCDLFKRLTYRTHEHKERSIGYTTVFGVQ